MAKNAARTRVPDTYEPDSTEQEISTEDDEGSASESPENEASVTRLNKHVEVSRDSIRP